MSSLLCCFGKLGIAVRYYFTIEARYSSDDQTDTCYGAFTVMLVMKALIFLFCMTSWKLINKSILTQK